jgi:DHA2 family multidrug resistance protein
MSRQSKLIVFVAVLASLLEIIDTSIVNVAIPTMMGSLGATLEDISMVITGYAIANAIVLPLASWLGDRIGRRTYYLGCIILFTLTSVACGLAPNLATLTIFRIFQGLAGGALLPTSQALIYEQFPKEKAGMAGAIFGMSVMIGPTLGPTLGGYLTDNFGWRSIFNINLPLGILALVIGSIVIFDRKREESEIAASKAAPIDFTGLLLLTIGIGCLQYTLERGEADDWFSSKIITTTAIASAMSLPLFVWWELRVKHPIINIRLFKDQIVTNGVLLMTSLGFFLYAVLFVLPVFVARVFNYNATDTGILFIPGSLLTAFLMPFVGRQMTKTDPKILIGIGLISIELCALIMTGFSTQTSHAQLMQALYMRGFALAFLFVPINSSILSQFKGAELGQVSGLMNLSRQIGGSMGIALVATLLNTATQQNFADLSSKVSMLNQQTQMAVMQNRSGMASKMVQEVGAGNTMSAAYKALYYRISNQAFMLSFLQLMFLIGAVFMLAFIPLIRLKLRFKAHAVDSH